MENFIKNFLQDLSEKTNQVSWRQIHLAIEVLSAAYERGAKIYLIGNGGSSAIASHFASDLNKTVLGRKGEKTAKRFQAVCLADNTPVITAWANDVGYEKIFSEQLKNFAQPKDVLIAVSSSGNSPNIVGAAVTAKKFSLPVVAFCGFDGGKLFTLADVKIHVPSDKYAIIESAHESICHLITTYFEQNIK